ncbi:MAG TPA: SseB family protein [Motilibacterales bacterium]|nr:SseB family protein [Motilibacterales bacterium]
MGDLTGPGAFAADDGTVPPEVADVLHRRAAGAAGVRDVVTCLSRHRVLVPLLEVDGDLLEGDDADPCAGSDRAVAAVSVREPDGRPLGLAFTGLAPLLAWDASARPLPVEVTRAAGAVLAAGGRALLLDAGSAHSVRIEGVALARLASGEPWPDPWDDPAVRDAVVGELGPVLARGEVQVRLAHPAAAGSHSGPGSDQAGQQIPGMVLEVRFAADVPDDLAQQRATVIATRMSQAASLREVFDGVLAVMVAR